MLPVPNSPPEKPPKRKLREFYNELALYEYSNPPHARQLVDELVERIDNYTGSPDVWHNAIMIASRLNHPRRIEIVRVALREWPDDVDLLCDDLQFCYGLEYDPDRAEELWLKLKSMGEDRTGPFWRYWVYGAVYNARMGRVQEGLELLDRGILAVKRDNLADVFRGYRSVLVDNVPGQVLANEDELVALQNDILKKLEAKLSLGIRLGIENGYVLAIELARLYQEMAGADFFHDHADNGHTAGSETQRRVNDKLRRALDILHLAECLYTGDPNHPIHEIYERRINLLMPLHEYDEALKLLLSLPPGPRRLEEQRIALDSMRRFATLKTGGSLEPEKSVPVASEKTTAEEKSAKETVWEVIRLLFDDEGEGLESLIRNNPPLQPTLVAVARKFGC